MSGHVLLVDPESELVFTLSHNEATPRCMMTLRHGGGTDEFIAFKVRKSLRRGPVLKFSPKRLTTRSRQFFAKMTQQFAMTTRKMISGLDCLVVPICVIINVRIGSVQ